ncbi:hypothetical protein [Atrimonas thermophila]|uniref:hypothetical protein n=1 Tax=Atrimonas thermophila TaxID=3064161 RepID=UPI00399D5062
MPTRRDFDLTREASRIIGESDTCVQTLTRAISGSGFYLVKREYYHSKNPQERAIQEFEYSPDQRLQKIRHYMFLNGTTEEFEEVVEWPSTT